MIARHLTPLIPLRHPSLSADLSSNEITQEGVEQLVNFLKELPHLRCHDGLSVRG